VPPDRLFKVCFANLKKKRLSQLTYSLNCSVVWPHAATRPNSLITKYFNRHQYCNFSEAQTAGSLMMVLLNRNM